MNADVCLVQMPYGAVERPSIALGTLHASLAGSGLASTVIYPNIWFAEDIGLDVYMAIVKMAGHTLVGEWTFAEAAFPGFAPDHDAFFRLNGGELEGLASTLLKRLEPQQTVAGLLTAVRRATSRFVDQVAVRVLELRPRVVGCTSTFQQHCASLALLGRIRELAPEVVTMLGGGNCEGAMGRATHRGFPWVDFVVSGEADAFFKDLCTLAVDLGKTVPASALPHGVLGPAHRNGSAEAAALGPAPRAVVDDLDVLPIPDYDHFFAELARSSLAPYVKPGLLVETARGCWWGQKHPCTFCGLNGAGITYRSKSADRVVRELETLSARHGLRAFEAVDNILDSRYFDSVLASPALAGQRYSLFYETKANLGRRHLARLSEAGVRWIQPGIESLHPGVLHLLQKGTSVATNLQLLKWAIEYGIRVEWLFLFGAPGEHDDWYSEMARWLPFISHLQPPSGLARIEYDRFSAYQTRPQEHGISLSPNRSYAFVYPLEGQEACDLAYFFEDYGDTRRGIPDPAGSPGLARWFTQAVAWRLAWLRADVGRVPAPPELRRVEAGSGLRVVDTRASAVAREHVLDRETAAVLRCCDQAVPMDRVAALVHERGGSRLSGPLVARICDELCERGLLLEIDGRLLDLTVPQAPPPLPKRYPGGDVDVGRYVQDRWLSRHAADGGLVTWLGQGCDAAAIAGGEGRADG